MKNLIAVLVLIAVTSVTATNAQHTVTSTENKKIVTHVSGSHYDVVYKNIDGEILQEGQYYKVGDRFKPHGVWKLYDRNSLNLITTAKYDKGEQIWVETIIDGKVLRVDKYELKVKRLEDRIAALEEKVNGL